MTLRWQSKRMRDTVTLTHQRNRKNGQNPDPAPKSRQGCLFHTFAQHVRECEGCFEHGDDHRSDCKKCGKGEAHAHDLRCM